MQTLTMFQNLLFQDEITSDEFQLLENKSYISKSYKDITLSGARVLNSIFEDVIFENCVFFATEFHDSIFINCLFINCQFKFASFASCNFESCQFDGCTWAKTGLQNSEFNLCSQTKNIGFEVSTVGTLSFDMTRTLSTDQFLMITA